MIKIDFQPMPKRFMVWDRHNKSFRINNDNGTQVFDMATLISFHMYEAECGIPYTDFDLVQSTNLFDKDGKEIFEGSIVPWNEDTGVVEWRNGKWVLPVTTSAFSVYHELGPNADMVKVIGHILSNPELVEGI